jgi:hypothetical protein
MLYDIGTNAMRQRGDDRRMTFLHSISLARYHDKIDRLETADLPESAGRYEEFTRAVAQHQMGMNQGIANQQVTPEAGIPAVHRREKMITPKGTSRFEAN